MSEIPVIKAALLGAGTVGGGVLRILEWQRDEMPKKLGVSIELKKILVRDKTKKREGIDSALLTEDWQEILSDPEIQIVIEVMGGIEPARTYILEALQAGKNVVTANKDLLAEHGRELLDTAERAGRDLMFEAAVAGGIPIIRPLKQCLAANHITEVMGIVNGTTNYILTRMTAEGWSSRKRWPAPQSWDMRKRIPRRILKATTRPGRWRSWRPLPLIPE